MIFFNAETNRLYSTNPDFYMSMGMVLEKYKENFRGGRINKRIELFEKINERSIASIDADHVSSFLTEEEIKGVLRVMNIQYTEIYG